MLNLQQKVKPGKATRRELWESRQSKLILCFHLNISIENYPQGQDHLLHHCTDHLLENWPKKTCRIGKFPLAYRTGKTREVIQFQFIWESVLMEGLFNTTQSTNPLPTLLTLCMLHNDKQRLRLMKGRKFRKVFNTKSTLRRRKISEEQLKRPEKKWRKFNRTRRFLSHKKTISKRDKSSDTTEKGSCKERTGWKK